MRRGCWNRVNLLDLRIEKLSSQRTHWWKLLSSLSFDVKSFVLFFQEWSTLCETWRLLFTIHFSQVQNFNILPKRQSGGQRERLMRKAGKARHIGYRLWNRLVSGDVSGGMSKSELEKLSSEWEGGKEGPEENSWTWVRDGRTGAWPRTKGEVCQRRPLAGSRPEELRKCLRPARPPALLFP